MALDPLFVACERPVSFATGQGWGPVEKAGGSAELFGSKIFIADSSLGSYLVETCTNSVFEPYRAAISCDI